MQKLVLLLIVINGMTGPTFGADSEEITSSDSFVVPKMDYSLGGVLKKEFPPTLKFPTSVTTVGDEGLGSGLTSNYSSLFVSKETSDLINCGGGINLELPSQTAVTLASTGISASCTSISDEDELLYTEDNCRLLSACAQSKTGREVVTFSNYTVGSSMAAEDLATLLLGDKLPTMEKLENLRKFADKKFGAGFSNACKPQFDPKDLKSDQCFHKTVEIGFQYLTESCSSAERSCYNVGENFGSNTPENESALINYFTQRTDAKVTEALAADNEMLDSLAQIMASKDSSDAKVKAVFEKLQQLRDEKKLDPVFDFESDIYDQNGLTSTDHYKFFKALAAKKLTTAAIKNEIEKHRRDYAKDVLTNDCKQSYNYGDICAKVTSASDGKTNLYPSRLKAASKLKNLDSKHLEFLKLVFSRSLHNDNDARIVLNASRCVALGVIPSAKLPDFNDVNMSISTLNPGGLGMKGPSFWDNPNSPYGSAIIFQKNDDLFVSPNLKISEKIRETTPETVKTLNERVPEEASEIHSRPIADTFTENMKNVNPSTNNTSFSSPNYSNSTAFNSIQSTSYNTAPAVESSVTEKKVSNTASASNPLNDRIADLTKKLSATEDHLSKLQESKDEAESDKAVQKKRDEDNKTIADLQNQIAELKKEGGKAPEKAIANIPEANPANLGRAPALAGQSPIVEAKKEEVDKGSVAAESAAARSSAPSGQAASSGGESAAIARNNSSGGAVSTSVSAGGKPLLVLSKSDGMTAEKITESISEKIIELGGQSFEIEENGVKMEIIPEMKNGKILLDAKGKPRFVKKVKSGKEIATIKTRVPASVTNKADLLRLDEEALKRERAEYLKLKNITNKAVQKKD